MPKEVITLSFGSYSSFVSAHYWNLQDEAAGYTEQEDWNEYAATVDHDVLYMSRETRSGTLTYRPRTIMFDTGASLGGVTFRGGEGSDVAYASAAASLPTWSGRVEVHRAERVARSSFVERLEEQEGLDLDGLSAEEATRHQAELEAAARQLDADGASSSGVRYWTDFCKATLDPRSVFCLPAHLLGAPGAGAGAGSSAGPGAAGGWGDAAEAVGPSSAGSELREAMADRVRVMGEACDSLAGFQVWADDLSGWGGLAHPLLTEVVEEYAGRPLVLYSLRQPDQATASAPAQGASTGHATARARQDLSEALATARMCELASLYVPLALPPARSALPYLAARPQLPFHSSAVLAAAIDTILMPVRLAASRSPLGEPVGATDLHSLVRLLRGRGGAPMAAAYLALPCPSLPADLPQLQAQLDSRRHGHAPPHGRHGGGGGAGAGPGGAGGAGGLQGAQVAGSTAQLGLGDLASLTPGVGGVGAAGGLALAECYALRGGRTDAGPASTSAASSALDVVLLRNPHRMCVRHRCVVPMPLPVPLPFPSIFAPCVSTHGDVVASGGGGGPALRGRAVDECVRSVPVLSMLQATAEFREWLLRVEGSWSRAAGSVPGRAVLDAWDLAGSEASEVAAELHGLAVSYESGDE